MRTAINIHIGQRDASKLTALVQADNQDDEDAPGAPDAAAYEGNREFTKGALVKGG